MIEKNLSAIKKLLKENQSLKIKVNKLENDMNGYNSSLKETIKEISSDQNTKEEQKPDDGVKIKKNCAQFQNGQSKYLLIDIFENFSKNSEEILDQHGWEKINSTTWISNHEDEQKMDEFLRDFPKKDFILYYQCIGRSTIDINSKKEFKYPKRIFKK